MKITPNPSKNQAKRTENSLFSKKSSFANNVLEIKEFKRAGYSSYKSLHPDILSLIPQLPPRTRRILDFILRFGGGYISWTEIGVAYLAAAEGCCHKTIKNHIVVLVSLGILHKKYSLKEINCYRLNPEFKAYRKESIFSRYFKYFPLALGLLLGMQSLAVSPSFGRNYPLLFLSKNIVIYNSLIDSHSLQSDIPPKDFQTKKGFKLKISDAVIQLCHAKGITDPASMWLIQKSYQDLQASKRKEPIKREACVIPNKQMSVTPVNLRSNNYDKKPIIEGPRLERLSQYSTAHKLEAIREKAKKSCAAPPADNWFVQFNRQRFVDK